MPGRATRRSKILYSLMGAMIALSVLPLAFVGWRLVAINRETVAANRRAFQLQIAQSRAREIEGYVERYLEETASLARSLESPGQAGEQFHDMMQRDARLLALAYVPSEGPAVWRDAGRLGQADLDAFAREAAEGVEAVGRYAGAPRLAGPERSPIVFVGDAVRVGGRPAGVAVAVVDLAPVVRFAGPVEAVEAAEPLFFVVDSGGAVLAQPDAPLPTALVKNWQRRDARDLSDDFDDDGGRKMLGAVATATLPGNVKLGVVSVVDRDTAFASVGRMSRQVLWAVLATALAAASIAVVLAGYITHPIRELISGARAIADENFEHRITVHSHDEIGQLAEDFNRMADRLQHTVAELRSAADKNHELFMGTLRAFAAAIDGKDPYTRGHSERVSEYSAAIAVELGLSEEEIEKVRVGGLMHDLGKLAIEDKILRKPAPLTEAEYEVMKEHPERGAKIMAEIPQMREYIPGMRFHHEMLNGQGYPLGLAGDQIPLMARIVGVADTFDAMTTTRPYQKQMELDVVLSRIQSLVGTRYDERVVAALVAACEHGRIKIRRPSPPKGSEARVS